MAEVDKSGPTHEAPFRGLKVLDLGQGVASPYCGMLLAIYGADVIKVEPPEGDWSRRLGTTYGPHSTLSAVYNRGKRSLALDLKSDNGLAIAKKLASECDVFIEGFRPGVAARLGLGYETLSEVNSKLVYLSVSGFGQTGPYTNRPCTDSVAQAFSGLVALNAGEDGIPHRVGTTISDICTGIYSFQAVSTALFARAHVGIGRWIDVNLAQSTAALLGHKLAEHFLEGGAPRALNTPAGCYRTADGWIVITLVTEAHYKRLCAAIGRADLANDARFSDFGKRADAADALVPQIRDAIAGSATDYWISVFKQADILAERVMTPIEWLNDPHVKQTRASVRQEVSGMGEVPSPRTPGFCSLNEDTLLPAPGVGEHSRSILADTGYSQSDIEHLIERRVVHTQMAAS
ncbi:CaiB/BaiF CoA transferase family protein [Tardiphaga sp. 803_E3_N1_3]|uniref:CaiB/BaiF CoA transferase family protein n=1 Tax=Tardiphaga sp. 803_E3_N1_3 TaxID=3240785 RepID=UPI003F2123FA